MAVMQDISACRLLRKPSARIVIIASAVIVIWLLVSTAVESRRPIIANEDIMLVGASESDLMLEIEHQVVMTDYSKEWRRRWGIGAAKIMRRPGEGLEEVPELPPLVLRATRTGDPQHPFIVYIGDEAVSTTAFGKVTWRERILRNWQKLAAFFS